MHTICKTLVILLALLACSALKTHAEVAKRVPLKTVPAFIEANKRNREVIFNNAKYDRNAKVYYIYPVPYVSYSSGIDKQTKFLAGVSRQIYRKGADLLVTIDYSDRDSEFTAGGNDVPGQAKSASVKSPIINSYKNVTKRALFNTDKYHRKVDSSSSRSSSTSYTYVSSSYMRAIDADGYLLAYFFQSGDSVIMYDTQTNKRETLIENVTDSDTWEADAILSTYKRLVARVNEQEAAEAPQETQKDEPVSKKKASKKESKEEEEEARARKKKRWKRVSVEN